MVTINNEDWRKYRLWVVVLRILVMGIPALLTGLLEWLYDFFEDLLLFLDRKLPEPLKRTEESSDG